MALRDGGVVTPQPKGIAGEMGINREATVFEALWAEAFNKKAHQLRQWHRQAQGLVVGPYSLLHRLPTVTGTENGAGFQLSFHQIEQLLTEGIAHGDPLTTETSPHVADHQIGSGVGVIEATQATGSENILEPWCIEPEKWHRFRTAIAVAEMDAEILHEFIVNHRGR